MEGWGMPKVIFRMPESLQCPLGRRRHSRWIIAGVEREDQVSARNGWSRSQEYTSMSSSEQSRMEQIESCLARFRNGDHSAVDELAELTYLRLKELVTAALRRFPALQTVMTADDVVHGRLLKRLESSLFTVRPETAQHLFSLASIQIRYELLSLIRRHQQERRVTSLQAMTDSEGRAHDPVDTRASAAAMLAKWECFNEQVERLPEGLREVVDLIYFQRMSQREAAALLGVTDRTIRSRLQAAKDELRNLTGDCVWLE